MLMCVNVHVLADFMRCRVQASLQASKHSLQCAAMQSMRKKSVYCVKVTLTRDDVISIATKHSVAMILTMQM